MVCDKYDSFEEAISDNTQVMFIEMLGNPNSNIDSHSQVTCLCHRCEITSICIIHSQLTKDELLQQCIKPNTIRGSIKTENVRDLIATLDEVSASCKETNKYQTINNMQVLF